jgi:hypothetical protein
VYRDWYGNGRAVCKGINRIDEDLKFKEKILVQYNTLECLGYQLLFSTKFS